MRKLDSLTKQERRVLKLVVAGLSNKEIAAALRLSPSTVRRHLEKTLRKLGVKNRVQAAVFAVREGNCRPGREKGRRLKKAA
jgi:DNA-binding NarL/FixJ family response regulator